MYSSASNVHLQNLDQITKRRVILHAASFWGHLPYLIIFIALATQYTV